MGTLLQPRETPIATRALTLPFAGGRNIRQVFFAARRMKKIDHHSVFEAYLQFGEIYLTDLPPPDVCQLAQERKKKVTLKS